jgi:NAD+ synthase (glutamine-hydrolysing)
MTTLSTTDPHSANSILAHTSMEQMNPTSGAVYANTREIIARLEAARARGSKLVVFPETSVSGYCVSDLVEDQDFLEANKEMLQTIAPHTKGVITVVGFIDSDASKLRADGRIEKYNAAALFCDGELMHVHRKRLLVNERYYDDKRFYSPGEESKAVRVTLDGTSLVVGVAICEEVWDQRYKTKPVAELAEQGAEVIVVLNASPTFPGKLAVRNQLLSTHSASHGIPLVYTNTVGAADIGKTILCFDGESLAYNAQGKPLALGKRFGVDSVDVDLTSSAQIELPRVSRSQHQFEGLVMAARDYASKTGFKKILVPVSGGIDSALGLAIAVEAVGAENVVAYNYPSKFNTDATKSIAEQLAHNFGVRYLVMPIQELDDLTQATIARYSHLIEKKITKENIHPRLRGLLSMAESNDLGYLLFSCGNKTEIALGYSTLYGDMCGGISIIGDLNKLDVYAVSRYVNERYRREVIPEETFALTPSAELSEGQYDPFDYSVVSPLVDAFIIERKSPSALLREFQEQRIDWPPDQAGMTVYDKHNAETFSDLCKQMYTLFRRSVYKRLQGPPIPSVSERTFGFDLRESLINAWAGKE